MKITLINPPVRLREPPNDFPLGLGYIASALLNEGHDVEALDINAYRWPKEEVEKIIKKLNCDVVGISGLITTYSYVKWLTHIIKKFHPNTKIILGGGVGCSIPSLVFENTQADIVVMGELSDYIRAQFRMDGRKGRLRI
jgi:radical SAM superfamily enzyme YgiQ (UPF0313 family)